MIRFILGKAKTGKTTHVYNCIKSDIDDKKEVILFVPSQSRAKAECQYMDILQKKGVMGVNITTISEFVKENLKLQNLHFDEKLISALDRKIILTQVVNENQELFEVFKNVKEYDGFLDTLDIYMDLMRKSNINPDDYIKINIDDKRVDKKFKEIASIYEKYIQKINEKYIDSIDEMALFIKNIDKCDELNDNARIYFDGYNNFTNSEYDFIDSVLKRNKDIMITLNTDITRTEDIYNSSPIFETSNKTYKKLCSIANKNKIQVENIVKYENMSTCPSDLKYLADCISYVNIEAPDKKMPMENLEVKLFTNTLKEVEEITNVILEKVEKGARFSDFAIYTTNIEEYYNMIFRIFYENNISLYASQKRSLSESLLTKYIIGVMNISTTGLLNIEKIFDVLKLGITDIDLKDICILENYIKEFNVNKYFINKPFTLNNQKATYNLDALNSVREKILNMYSFLADIRKDTTALEIVTCIYNHLNVENIFLNYKKYLDILTTDVLNIDVMNFEKQSWNAISQIFDSIVKIYKEKKITLNEFLNIFKLVIKDVKIKTLPPTKDQVELLDINVSKIQPKKYVFFIGVVESKFPKKVEEDIFFGDLELEKLKAKNIELKETTISKINMGMFNIYEGLNNVLEKLYIYIPTSSIDGKATRRSSLITELQMQVEFDIKGEVTQKEKNVNLNTKDKLFIYFVNKLQTLTDKEIQINEETLKELVNLYEFLRQDEKYNKIFEYKKDDSNLSDEVTQIIYSEEFNTSISKLELYKKCPFSYFMKYILRVEPNKEAKVNSLEVGTFMHEVLENFSKYLLKENIYWQQILDDELENLKPEYETILVKIIDESLELNLKKQQQSVRYVVLRRKLINTMKKVMRVIAMSYNQSEFMPLDYEVEFKEDGIFLPMIIKLDNNKEMKIIGKIDRLDFLNYNDTMYVRIIDYKSSSKNLSIEDIKEGISLQLISYLMAFIENKKQECNIKPAAMLYFNLSDKLVALSQYEQSNENIRKALMKKLKMTGIFLKDIEILNKMDRNFETDSASSFIDITKRSITPESKKALDDSEFDNLCNDTKNILKQIGQELSRGNVEICPNKKTDYCKYCNYSTTCRKNIIV